MRGVPLQDQVCRGTAFFIKKAKHGSCEPGQTVSPKVVRVMPGSASPHVHPQTAAQHFERYLLLSGLMYIRGLSQCMYFVPLIPLHPYVPFCRDPLYRGGLDVNRKEAWPFYRTSSGVRLCWELEEPKGPKHTHTDSSPARPAAPALAPEYRPDGLTGLLHKETRPLRTLQ